MPEKKLDGRGKSDEMCHELFKYFAIRKYLSSILQYGNILDFIKQLAMCWQYLCIDVCIEKMKKDWNSREEHEDDQYKEGGGQHNLGAENREDFSFDCNYLYICLSVYNIYCTMYMCTCYDYLGCFSMIGRFYGRSVTVQRNRHIGNLKVLLTNWRTDGPTNQLTGVGAGDAYECKKQTLLFENIPSLSLSMTVV